jgi:transposase
MTRASRAWASIDAGKGHHHVHVIDADGNRLLSRRVANDEVELTDMITQILALAEDVTWAIDLADGGAALAIALLLDRKQRVHYLPGAAVSRATGTYRGEGKTDAKDAAVIADQARMRRDLATLKVKDELVVELGMLTAQRSDLTAERTRTINRLRSRLMEIFPALERELDFTNQGPLILVGAFQTPQKLREIGRAGLVRWLAENKVRGIEKLAVKAMRAAHAQHVRVAGQYMAAPLLIARLARMILDLDRQLSEIDELIAERFRRHRDADIITSMVGIGTLLGAEFLAATGGDLSSFGSADHLAGYAGLAPMPRDSGRRPGNLHRPKRYNRELQRVYYTSALLSIQRSPSSRAFYDRKRAEGKRHGPSGSVSRPPPRQRPLGTTPRSRTLRESPILQPSDRSLTNGLRIPCRRQPLLPVSFV